MSRRSQRKGKFKFELHNDYAVGPSRTTNDSTKAVTYFTRIQGRGWKETMMAKITHVPSGLYLEAADVTELKEIIHRVVNPINARK